MGFVLTVIGAPGSSTLDDGVLEAARAALAHAGARPGAPVWLDPGIACDLPFEDASPEAAESAVRADLAGAPLDIAAQGVGGRRKALLLADMESTIIAEEMLDRLAAEAGMGPQIAEITARSMAGEMDFAAALKQRVRLLAGLPVSEVTRMSGRFTLNPGARTLVQTMRANGAYTVLVSGGFIDFTEPVRRACGFHEARGNRLIIQHDTLSGAVATPIFDREAKRATLRELTARHGLDAAAACALGDGSNDTAMVAAAGLGVAYRAKPVLRAAARFRVDHGDLSALLFLQGYRRDEFRT